MSAAKRSRRRQTEARAASPLPASKRLKTNRAAHVPAHAGLGFLVDEDARNGRKLEARLTNGVPSSRTTRVDESHARVASDMKDREGRDQGSSPENAIGISSGEEESEDGEGEDEDAEDAPIPLNRISGKALPNGHLEEDVDGDMSEADAVAGAEDVRMEEPEAEEELEEPSFGDMLQARHPDPIDIQDSFPKQALLPHSTNLPLATLSGTSLTTVLTQALKTSDKDLLETCFRTTDLPTIRTTIQRLPSQHITTLLQRLAERIHKRPGRTGSLLVWVQWSLIAHGGYLAGQKELMRELKSLVDVVRQRASGLQSLLVLKGKLDLLSAQLELRRNLQAASRAAHGESEDDEEGVVYVEGEEEEPWSDDDEEEKDVQVGSSVIKPGSSKDKFQTATPRSNQSDSEDESDDDLPNGITQEADDESSQDEEEGMFDVEAEETSDDDEDEGESDEEADSDPESEEADDVSSDNESDVSGPVKPPQPKTLNRKR